MYQYKQIIIGIVVGVVIGGFIFESGLIDKGSVSASSKEGRSGMQIFTNPLLECLSDDQIKNITNLNISKSVLSNFVDDIKSKNKLKSVSVYIRDLNNGPWIGINEKEEFIGGSLLKVPVLISIMKMVQNNPSLLDEKVEYKNKITTEEQYFKPSNKLEVGKSYSVQELIEYMIYYSDNDAGALLAGGLKEEDIKNTFESIGLGSPENNKSFPVTSKVYAGFFRILFNSSYLSRDFSEATLNILSQTEFNKGLTAKLPKNIRVAHKFGIRDEDNIKQLHDCGIVYQPKSPYLLCVMTKGDDYENMASSIAEISKFIYDQVSENSK